MEPPASIVSDLHGEAERLLKNPGSYDQWRLDLTQQGLGVEDYPIIEPTGEEMEFHPDPEAHKRRATEVSPKGNRLKFPKARIIGTDGKVIEVRRMTPEEAIKFQPESPPKEGIAPKPLTEDEIRALFEPVRERMKAEGCYTEEQIRVRLDRFRKRQRKAEDRIPPS